MFQTLIVQPIFNLLVLILALVPGHNFGLAIIIFTIIVRLLLWPLVKKQLHQAKLMRKIQPELKKISQEAKGNKQKQALMQMELYKERGISPFQSIGVVLLQLPILIGLYIGLQKVLKEPRELVNFAYGPLHELPWLQQLADNIKVFDTTFFGIFDLERAALSNGSIYFPALLIVALSAIVQYYQAKQLAPNADDARSLRTILKEAGNGKQADQSEINAAVSRFTLILLPAMVFIFTIGIASALSLYILVGSLVAFIQQSYVLREDAEEMDKLSQPNAKNTADIPEAEIVADTTPSEQKAKKKLSRSKKRRRK